jgi:hypothetical protein
LRYRSRRIAGSVRHAGIVAVGAYPPRISTTISTVGALAARHAGLRRAP